MYNQSASSTIRMSGINSGLDTEALVSAMTAATKNKINTQERKVLKLQAQQTAYRDIISKMTAFQDKYFDVLNQKTYLGTSAIFNRYSNKVSVGNTDTSPAGVTVTTSSSTGQAGSYDVTVNQVATQATVKSAAAGSSSGLDLAACTDPDKTYGMSVTVGSTTKVITFQGAAAKEDVAANINKELQKFGVSSDTATTGKGLVYVDDTGKVISKNQQQVKTGAIAEMTSLKGLDISNLQTGNNSFTIQVGDTTKTISFSTIDKDYYNDIFNDDGTLKDGYKKDDDGNTVLDDKGNPVVDTALTKKIDAFKEVRANLYDSEVNESYETWKETATDAEKEDLFNKAFDEATLNQYNTYKDKTAKAAYIAGIEDGSIPSNVNDPGYKTLDEYVADYTDEQFEASDSYQDYLDRKLDRDLWKGASYKEFSAYKTHVYSGIESEDDFNASVSQDEVTNWFNECNIANSLGSLKFDDGTKIGVEFDFATGELGVEAYTEVKDADGNVTGTNPVDFGITAAVNSTNTLGATQATSSVNQVSTSTKLSELGLTPNADGKYTFSINGVDFAFDEDTTIKKMMNDINDSAAGVKMTYTTLDNTFTITNKEYGAGKEITFSDGSEGLLNYIGFNGGETSKEGTNTMLDINGVSVETDSNSYTVDGTTFTFTQAAVGSNFQTEVEVDYTDAIEAIKSFVADYNQLIEDVYGYVDEKPDDDYYFLTDQDIEDMALSEKQEEKWEAKAKQGLLYHDSTVSDIMTKLRSALYGSVEAGDGTKVGLYNIGITTSSNWTEHGKLVLDETALTEAFSKYSDEIADLFSDSENGIMKQFDSVLTSAVKTTGTRAEKGVLVQKAGVENGTSATDNAIYDQLKSIAELIDSLNERYEKEQTRYWSIYSNLESMMSDLNSQTSYITQLMSM